MGWASPGHQAANRPPPTEAVRFVPSDKAITTRPISDPTLPCRYDVESSPEADPPDDGKISSGPGWAGPAPDEKPEPSTDGVPLGSSFAKHSAVSPSASP